MSRVASSPKTRVDRPAPAPVVTVAPRRDPLWQGLAAYLLARGGGAPPALLDGLDDSAAEAVRAALGPLEALSPEARRAELTCTFGPTREAGTRLSELWACATPRFRLALKRAAPPALRACLPIPDAEEASAELPAPLLALARRLLREATR
jgi:hypothetical protein